MSKIQKRATKVLRCMEYNTRKKETQCTNYEIYLKDL